jgi:hypothetical protein
LVADGKVLLVLLGADEPVVALGEIEAVLGPILRNQFSRSSRINHYLVKFNFVIMSLPMWLLKYLKSQKVCP